MAIDFPASPTLNQTFSSGNVNYIWDGTKWTASVTGGISLDKIEKGNTKAEVVDTGSDGRFVVTTEGSERLRVDSSGRVGIGTTSPAARLEVSTGAGTEARITSTIDNNADLTFYTNGVQRGIIEGNSLGLALGTTGALPTFFVTNNTERARIDSSGRLLVGTSTYSGNGKLIAAGNTGGNAGTLDICWTGSRPTAADTDIGYIRWYSVDNSSGNAHYASIYASSDGASSSGSDIPGRLVFSTTADGASSPTERMRIQSDGNIAVGAIASNGYRIRVVQSSIAVASFQRDVNDGDLIDFHQDAAKEGSISVSGTTVSYNGAHLSRWAQLPSGAERIEILRGSVLSNIDEMCEWGDEDNEQLNRMKVSDVEGDKNVSGVFQGWDDDDDTYTNDFYCAMTGDFIIRIGAGVTVERGDLLMSAGDGTAKPQGDGYVQDKTIAKVTSINVSCTYDDGSYCVPCVLMAC